MRSVSLDFLRGLAVALLLLITAPGSWEAIYAPLQFAEWHGCTLADLVFPTFLFVMGAAMWFSFEKYDHAWSRELAVKILRRSAILVAIGLIINLLFMFGQVQYWRIPGVLQRVGVCYLVASVLCLSLPRKALLVTAAGLLLLYWGLLNWLFSAPFGGPYVLETNAVLTLDRAVFGNEHLWHGERIPFDSEGLLSTLPAIVTVLLGWLTGKMLAQRSEKRDLLVRDLLVYGIVLGFFGLAWDLFFPINRKLWTSSFVLYSGSIAFVLLAASVWLLEVRKWRNGTGFFTVLGRNSLVAYLFSQLLIGALIWVKIDGHTSIQQAIFKGLFGLVGDSRLASLLFAAAFTALVWAVCRALYARKWFLGTALKI